MNNLPTIIEEAREKFDREKSFIYSDLKVINGQNHFKNGTEQDEDMKSFLERQIIIAYNQGASSRDQALRTLIEGMKKEIEKGVDELGRPKEMTVILDIAKQKGFNQALTDLLETLSEK
mgnify:CR=1 FL=1